MTKNIIMIVAASFFNVLAQISLKKAAGFNLLEAGFSPLTLVKLANNFYLWSGLIFYGISFMVTIKIYETLNLSFVTPLSIGIIFILTTLLSIVIFNESFNMQKVFGTIIIFVGIVILSTSGQK